MFFQQLLYLVPDCRQRTVLDFYQPVACECVNTEVAYANFQTCMLVRIMEMIPKQTSVAVQMMRDDTFDEPIGSPLNGIVVRYDGSSGGITDHGITLLREDVRREPTKPIEIPNRPPSAPTPRTRMHNLDYTIGESVRRTRG